MSKDEVHRWEKMCPYSTGAFQVQDVPGLVLRILHQDQENVKGFGVTNLDHPLEMTAETLSQNGAITMTDTGTLPIKLMEEGEIDLDASVRSYLPESKVRDREVSEKVPIRRLMSHTSGWFGDFSLDTGPGNGSAARYMAEMKKVDQLAPLPDK